MMRDLKAAVAAFGRSSATPMAAASDRQTGRDLEETPASTAAEAPAIAASEDIIASAIRTSSSAEIVPRGDHRMEEIDDSERKDPPVAVVGRDSDGPDGAVASAAAVTILAAEAEVLLSAAERIALMRLQEGYRGLLACVLVRGLVADVAAAGSSGGQSGGPSGGREGRSGASLG